MRRDRAYRGASSVNSRFTTLWFDNFVPCQEDLKEEPHPNLHVLVTLYSFLPEQLSAAVFCLLYTRFYRLLFLSLF
jgi:hypothetical protein